MWPEASVALKRYLMSETMLFKLLIGKKAEKATDERDELAVDCKFRTLVAYLIGQMNNGRSEVGP